MGTRVSSKVSSKVRKNLKYVKNNIILYIFLVPTFVYFLLFRVVPIYNMRLAFYKYSLKGQWVYVGLKYFKQVFDSPAFYNIIWNTIVISFMKYVLLFPVFVLFAILLNEVKSEKFRKYVQVVTFLPHFLSWVVIAGVWISFLSRGNGLNSIFSIFGMPEIDFLTDKGKIRYILLFSEAWRSVGWDSIIFFSCILTIDKSLIESAEIDGAGRLSVIGSIIIPTLVAPMMTVFILNFGFFLNAGFDQVFNFTNDSVNSVIDILDTYIFRVGIISGSYSIGTAVGVMKGLLGLLLVLVSHFSCKKFFGEGIW